ncbi:HORMA domain [Nesidiocoris tenuis]|nr:HORMA domain [Nesidiocoris tenuis]
MYGNVVPLIVEFLEVAIHGVLYYRKIYPEAIFTLKKKYDVPVHISLYPELNNYINETLKIIAKMLEIGSLDEVCICFYDACLSPVEKLVLKLDAFDKSGDLSEADPYLVNLRECFRAFMLKLSVSTSYLASLPENATFKILLRTTETTAVRVNLDPNFQEFPLIEVEPKENSPSDREILPLKTIVHDMIKINAYFQKKIS